MKKTTILVLCVLLMVIFLLFYNSYKSQNITSVYFDDVKVSVEVAESQDEITKGLMYREELGENEGMLFIFQDEKERTFWMKNMLIPLDMIFLDSEKNIVQIVKNAEPCTESLCPLYSSQFLSKYVIEVNSGFADKPNIQVGQEVSFS